MRWRGQLLWTIALVVLAILIVYISNFLEIEYLWMGGSVLLFAAFILFVLGVIGLIANRSTFRERWTRRQWLAPVIVIIFSLVGIFIVKFINTTEKTDTVGDKYVLLNYIPGSDNTKVALVDYKGKLIAAYDKSSKFTKVGDGAFWIDNGDGYMLYNVSDPGVPVSYEAYSMVTPFGDGVAAVGNGTSPIKLINTKGETIAELPGWIGEVGAFSDGRAKYLDTRNQKYGYLDTKGYVIIEASFFDAYPFDDGYAIVYEDCEDSYKINTYGVNSGVDYVANYAIMPYYDASKDKNGVMETKTQKKIIPAMYDIVYVVGNNRIIVYNNESGGLVDSKNQPVIPMRKYASISPLAGGNFLLTAPDAESGTEQLKAGPGADPLFLPGDCTWVINSKGRKISATYGSPISVLGKYDASVTYTDISQAIDPMLNQLKQDEAFGFKKGTDAATVASRLEWEVRNDNLSNFNDPWHCMEYYMELPEGIYIKLILSFDGELYRPITHQEQRGSGWLAYEETVIDGYEFNPETLLEAIYIPVEDLPTGALTTDKVMNYIEKALADKGLENVNFGRYLGDTVIIYQFE